MKKFASIRSASALSELVDIKDVQRGERRALEEAADKTSSIALPVQSLFILILKALLVGCIAGSLVVCYRFTLSYAERFFRLLMSIGSMHLLLLVAVFIFLIVLCFIVSKLSLFEPHSLGSGIPQSEAEIKGHLNMVWYRVLCVKFLEGILCTAAGLSLGREGPSVLLGALSGKAVTSFTHSSQQKEEHKAALMTCGAASGMAAAFSAPVTAILFALEEIQHKFSPLQFILVAISALTSGMFAIYVFGADPLIKLNLIANTSFSFYMFVVLLGVTCGILGAIHNRGMAFLHEKLYSRIKKHLPFSRFIIPFLLAGVVALVLPQINCGGDAIIGLLSQPQKLSISVLIVLLISKYLYTAICFASDAPGGTLLPLVALSVLIGALYTNCIAIASQSMNMYMSNFIVLSIAGLFAASIKAPLTGVVLSLELTGSFNALLLATLTAGVAYTVSHMLGTEGFYERLLKPLMKKSSEIKDKSAVTEN